MANEIEKRNANRKLTYQLIANPPPLSILDGQKIWNRFQLLNNKGEDTSLWWSMQTMTDLKRFSRRLIGIKEIIQCGRRSFAQINELEDFAADYYATWHVSSSEVIRSLGIDEALSIFQILRGVFHITWPGDSFDYFMDDRTPPAGLKIYRGESIELAKSGIASGMSWSLCRSTAQYYALKHKDGVLRQGIVSFENVLLFRHEESEVIVNPETVIEVGNH